MNERIMRIIAIVLASILYWGVIWLIGRAIGKW
jgi:hypothetical protein